MWPSKRRLFSGLRDSTEVGGEAFFPSTPAYRAPKSDAPLRVPEGGVAFVSAAREGAEIPGCVDYLAERNFRPRPAMPMRPKANSTMEAGSGTGAAPMPGTLIMKS